VTGEGEGHQDRFRSGRGRSGGPGTSNSRFADSVYWSGLTNYHNKQLSLYCPNTTFYNSFTCTANI
jgi:hypothetical protein